MWIRRWLSPSQSRPGVAIPASQPDPGTLASGRSDRTNSSRNATGRNEPFEPRARIESAKKMDYERLLESLEVRDLGHMLQIVMAAGRHRITPANNLIDLQSERAFETQWQRSQLKLFLLASSDDQTRFREAAQANVHAVVERVREIVTRVQAASSSLTLNPFYLVITHSFISGIAGVENEPVDGRFELERILDAITIPVFSR